MLLDFFYTIFSITHLDLALLTFFSWNTIHPTLKPISKNEIACILPAPPTTGSQRLNQQPANKEQTHHGWDLNPGVVDSIHPLNHPR